MTIPTQTGPMGRRGSSLLIVLIAVMTLAGMSAALISTTLYRQSASRSVYEKERALQASMTGLDLALFELQEALDTGADGIGVATGQIDAAEYTITITPAYVGVREYTLRAAGRYGPVRQGIELVISPDNTFPFGMFGRDHITLTGAFGVDSYHADLGTYATQAFGGHAGDDGDIGSNGDITVGSGMVYGDATPGPGQQVLGDLSKVNGSTAPATRTRDFEPVTYSPTVASSGGWFGSGTLNTGTYRYDDILLVGTDVLTLDGDITLYVDGSIQALGTSSITIASGASVTIIHGSGNVSIGGTGFVNLDSDPSSLTFSSATTGTVGLSGTADYYGLIYAPEADFGMLGDSDYFGVVVGNSVEINGSGMLHFDESLKVPDQQVVFWVKSARKISPLGI